MEKCEHDYNGVDGGPCIKCGKTVNDLMHEGLKKHCESSSQQNEQLGITVRSTKQCPTCKGEGTERLTSLGETIAMLCRECKGRGEIPYTPGVTPWVVTVKRGEWTCTRESQFNADDALEQVLTEYDIVHFPDRDRHGGMN